MTAYAARWRALGARAWYGALVAYVVACVGVALVQDRARARAEAARVRAMLDTAEVAERMTRARAEEPTDA